MPNTAKVIYAWDKKILCFSKISKIYKNDHMIDIHVRLLGQLYWVGDTLEDETSTSSGIDPVVKIVIKGTWIIIWYARRIQHS